MLIDKKGNTTIVTQEKATVTELVQRLEQNYEHYKSDNLIINLFSLKESKTIPLAEFLRLSEKHKLGKHSLVLVNKYLPFDAIPEGLNVVPTLVEAHDLIEMEEIERDLGI